MVNRVLLATAPALAIHPAIRAAFRRAGRRFSSLKYRWLRLVHYSTWLSLYAAFFAAVMASLAVVPLLGLALIGGWMLHQRKQQQRAGDTEYGQAKFATLRDLAWRGFFYARSGIPVGRVLDGAGGGPKLALDVLKYYPKHSDEQAVRISQGIWYLTANEALITLPEHDIVHMSIYGRSGSGKSQGHAIGCLLTDPSAMVVTDNKGELSWATARHRAEVFNHEIVCIAPFGGAPDGFRNHAFNPLSAVNLNSQHLVSDAIHFAKALVRPDKQDHNPFFLKSAVIVLDAVLSFLLCHAVPSQCNLQKLLQITSSPDALRNMAEIMLQSDFGGGYLRLKAQQLLSLTGKTLMDVLATLNTHLFWLASLDIEQATHWTTFPIHKLLNGQMTIYLIFPTDRAEDYSALIRIWITAIAHVIFAAGVNRSEPIRFLFDEASLLGQDMPVLERMLTKGRGYGVKMNFYWQSVHQIAEVFPDHQAQVFREQMSAEQFMEVSNYQSAKEISQWIGQTTVRVANASYTDGWSRSDTAALHPSWTTGSSGSATHGYQKAGRALMQPEELLQLPSDVTVVLKPGCPPILAKKLKAYLTRDYVELISLPFSAPPDIAAAISRRRVIAVIVLLFLGGLGFTHPQETQKIKNDLVAAWNRHPLPSQVQRAELERQTLMDKKSPSKKSRQKSRQRERMPRGFYRYGY